MQNFNILPEAADILGLSYKDLLDYTREDLVPLMEGTLSAEEFWKHLSSSSGIIVDRELWSDLFNPSPDKVTMRLIKQLRKSYRIVCGTNTLTEHYNFHQKRGDYNVFDKVYASHLMGIAKPKSEFYELILNQEDVQPEEAIFIDDFPENIETAQNMGINSFLFKNANLFEKELIAKIPNIYQEHLLRREN